MSDRHTNSGPGEGELTTEDLARPGRESRPDTRSGPLSEQRPDTPADTGHDAPPDARSGPLSGARPGHTAERTSEAPPPAYPGEASAVSGDAPGVTGERESVPERTATGGQAAPDRGPVTGRDDRGPVTGQDDRGSVTGHDDRGSHPDGDQRQGDGRPRSVDEGADPLIAHQEADTFRERWAKIQGTFVDDPKDAVRSADALVADVIQSLAATFADHKKELEGQWSRGESVETEGLRVALQQYRTFFNQLLDA
ncbi:hypothetical protein [Streptomyces griseoluteus]|uniref:hypothetical protein n=1 Tax=Streptomyces griseoluteus TaxID=29306 RepID=UPI0036E0DEF2